MKVFAFISVFLAVACEIGAAEKILMTTGGPVGAREAGLILAHEHIVTDLRGPDKPGYGEVDPEDVVRVMKPLLLEAKESGVGALVECTTIGVGRNVSVIARLAKESGLKIVVPTGVYGRANFAPKAYAAMSEDELTRWMIREITIGIDDTGVKAGFIKTAASETELRPLEEKFLRASGRTSLETGVAIASHTTSGEIARKQADILESLKVPLHRFVWVHAQAEANLDFHKELARKGVYIELDSVGGSDQEDEKIIKAIRVLVDAGFGDRILISQDAGWYNPGQPNGGSQRGFTSLTKSFLPKLKKAGFSDEVIHQITHENPFTAFAMAGK